MNSNQSELMLWFTDFFILLIFVLNFLGSIHTDQLQFTSLCWWSAGLWKNKDDGWCEKALHWNYSEGLLTHSHTLLNTCTHTHASSSGETHLSEWWSLFELASFCATINSLMRFSASCFLSFQLVLNDRTIPITTGSAGGVNVANSAHPCVESPCANGGTCRPKWDSYECDCPLGYDGRHCQKGQL